tara:strand:- start:546 stop:1148 length:603 start_codon:yes stop_codon:yes gene_type:complete
MILFSDKFLLPIVKIDSIRDTYKKDEYKITMEDSGYLWSSYYTCNQDELLKDIYEDKILQCLKHIPVSTSRGYLQNPILSYWVQLYDDKAAGGHPIHDHWSPDCMISFVHFIKVPKQNCFYFKADEKMYPKQDEGDIIFFPSWASHGVDPVVDFDDRIVLAGNVSVGSFISKQSNRMSYRWKLTKSENSYLWEQSTLTNR